MIRAVLFDLDGVIRHFDAAVLDDIERRHGLAPGTVPAAAFAEPGLTALVTGRLSRADWLAAVAERVGSVEAVTDWGSQEANVDAAVLGLAAELRAAGLGTAILTNGTDATAAEVERLGLGGHFDAVFNSAEIGWAKPDPRAFQHVLDALGRSGSEVFFTDDSAAKLAGAVDSGMATHHFEGVAGLRKALRAAGVPLG